MSGGLYPIAGSKLYIGSKVAGKGTVTAADFASADWTEIGGWASAGTIGDTQEVGEQSLISEDRMRKFKTIKNGGTMENTFVPMFLDAGQSKFRDAIEDKCGVYQFKIEWGGECAPTATVTFTVAADTATKVNWTAHGFSAGQPIIFAGGTPPTGISTGVVYYVIAAGLEAGSFQISNTPTGSGIIATGSASGTVTADAPPAGMTDMFFGLAMPGARSGGDATAAHLRTWSIAVDSNIVEV